MIEVLESGPLATVQDLGRPGYAHLGVPMSGAADQRSHRLANRLVGNYEHAATLELLFGGVVLRFHRPAIIALTGAPAPARVDERALSLCEPKLVHPGQVLRVGMATHGLRSYLAVQGGIEVALTLGSRATDTLSGLGPAPLRPGDSLPIGHAPMNAPPRVDVAYCAMAAASDPVLRVHPGPREDWFSPDAFTTLTSTPWTVTAETNRVGARLCGPPLHHAGSAQLPSEGMVLGAIQVPPSGQPIIFLADHPTTGGYPVLGVIASQDVDLLAQARPGSHLRFRPQQRCQSALRAAPSSRQEAVRATAS